MEGGLGQGGQQRAPTGQPTANVDVVVAIGELLVEATNLHEVLPAEAHIATGEIDKRISSRAALCEGGRLLVETDTAQAIAHCVTELTQPAAAVEHDAPRARHMLVAIGGKQLGEPD